MREILRELNTRSGIRGSALVMADGVVVAAELAMGTDAEPYCALVSSLLAQLERNMPKLGLGSVKRALVTASRGCFALTDLGGAFLVTELERETDLSLVEIEIESYAGRLRKELHPKQEPPPPAALPDAVTARATAPA